MHHRGFLHACRYQCAGTATDESFENGGTGWTFKGDVRVFDDRLYTRFGKARVPQVTPTQNTITHTHTRSGRGSEREG